MVLATDAFDRHLVRPFLQRMHGLRQRVADAITELGDNAQLDQYPARRVPAHTTRIFGPITAPIVARRNASSAQENSPAAGTGVLAQPDVFITPRNGNILVGRDGRFVLRKLSAHAYMSLTWSVDPADLPTNVQAFSVQGDLFDDVVRGNGGGLVMDQFGYVPVAVNAVGANNLAFTTFAWRLGLRDKKRDRFLHDGESLPSSVFAGGALTKSLAFDGRFEEATEIEPRLYIDEISTALQLTATDLVDVRWKLWLVLSMGGYVEQNRDRGVGREVGGNPW